MNSSAKISFKMQFFPSFQNSRRFTIVRRPACAEKSNDIYSTLFRVLFKLISIIINFIDAGQERERLLIKKYDKQDPKKY
jgi:hypothetical protein